MPSRLRPTTPYATDAILVGDPGRALLLAQELLEQPKMSNHARGLWGYCGRTPRGDELTVQSTGMGGPARPSCSTTSPSSACAGCIRVSSCARRGAAGLLLVERRRRPRRHRRLLRPLAGGAVPPDPGLTAALVASSATRRAPERRQPRHDAPSARRVRRRDGAADMQTVAILAVAARRSHRRGGGPRPGRNVDGGDLPRRESRASSRNAPDRPPPPYSQLRVEG